MPGVGAREELRIMKPIELVGHIDEQHRLHVELPTDVPPGPVKVTLQKVMAEEVEGDWRALINQSWATDWSDPRETIYTLEDGMPSHESRRKESEHQGPLFE